MSKPTSSAKTHIETLYKKNSSGSHTKGTIESAMGNFSKVTCFIFEVCPSFFRLILTDK